MVELLPHKRGMVWATPVLLPDVVKSYNRLATPRRNKENRVKLHGNTSQERNGPSRGSGPEGFGV